MLAKIHLANRFSSFMEINFPVNKIQIQRAVVELFETMILSSLEMIVLKILLWWNMQFLL